MVESIVHCLGLKQVILIVCYKLKQLFESDNLYIIFLAAYCCDMIFARVTYM